MRIIVSWISLACLVLFFSQQTLAQAAISGQTCVVPGTLYQYILSESRDSVSSIQVCVSGGTLTDSVDGNTCMQSTHSLKKVMVIWNDTNADHGSLNVTSGNGSFILTVHFTKHLLAGKIDSAFKVQLINWKTVPASIKCNSDEGGSCSPLYTHQWQWSPDAVNWKDIPLATGKDLTIDSAITQSKFYRRKVTELNSGSIAYSDVASVLVISPPDSTIHLNGIGLIRSDQYDIQQNNSIYIEVTWPSSIDALFQDALICKSLLNSIATTIEKE